MSALARERMMCGECVEVSVLVSSNFCFYHTCIYEITGSGFRSVVSTHDLQAVFRMNSYILLKKTSAWTMIKLLSN